ncbi:olfactory receptor 5G9-like [Mixophyes fleayi]|uniref:olfactory receptor 5G9-like n=1 Tax=Mixophyes fleayi TaxID=3061075 RepID=UPI003F4D9F79
MQQTIEPGPVSKQMSGLPEIKIVQRHDRYIMEIGNETSFVDFILQGLTADNFLQLLLFVLFLIIYLCSFVSNLCMMLLIRTVHHLHTPMYFFLSHLSFVDLCYSSTITPKMLSDFLSEKKSISFIGCASQMFSFAMFATSESLLVTAMAYDRYVAICRPLVYYNFMNRSTCWGLVLGAYFSSLPAAITHTITIFMFPLCGSNKINHFYCDIPPLLKLACAYSHIRKLVVFLLSLVMGMVSFFVILMSYVSIICAILGIHSTDGRSKAFSTCASHLIVVISFYSTVFGIYFRPSLGLNSDSIDKVFSIFYTVASPLLNPLIYSFKNAEVKRAVLKVFLLNEVPRYSKQPLGFG